MLIIHNNLVWTPEPLRKILQKLCARKINAKSNSCLERGREGDENLKSGDGFRVNSDIGQGLIFASNIIKLIPNLGDKHK